MKLFNTDFVIVHADTNEPYETNSDITSYIYGADSVVDMEIDNGRLEDWLPNTKWLPMTELSKEWQSKFINELTAMGRI